MLTILAILIILIIVVLTKVLRYDCYPCGTKSGYQGAPSFEGRFDIFNRHNKKFAAWFRAVSGLFHSLSYIKVILLYAGSSIFG